MRQELTITATGRVEGVFSAISNTENIITRTNMLNSGQLAAGNFLSINSIEKEVFIESTNLLHLMEGPWITIDDNSVSINVQVPNANVVTEIWYQERYL